MINIHNYFIIFLLTLNNHFSSGHKDVLKGGFCKAGKQIVIKKARKLEPLLKETSGVVYNEKNGLLYSINDG